MTAFALIGGRSTEKEFSVVADEEVQASCHLNWCRILFYWNPTGHKVMILSQPA